MVVIFKLGGIVTVSCHTTVEAESEEEAIEIASGRSVEIDGFGHRSDESWIIEEGDGDPERITVNGTSTDT